MASSRSKIREYQANRSRSAYPPKVHKVESEGDLARLMEKLCRLPLQPSLQAIVFSRVASITSADGAGSFMGRSEHDQDCRRAISYWKIIKGYIRASQDHVDEAFRILFGPVVEASSSTTHTSSTPPNMDKSIPYILLNYPHAKVRQNAVELVEALHSRSAKFRQLVFQHLNLFVHYAAGVGGQATKRLANRLALTLKGNVDRARSERHEDAPIVLGEASLPGPMKEAMALIKYTIDLLARWREQYNHECPQLQVVCRYLEKMDLTWEQRSAQPGVSSSLPGSYQNRSRDLGRHPLPQYAATKHRKNQDMEKLMENKTQAVIVTLHEMEDKHSLELLTETLKRMDSCFKLLMPSWTSRVAQDPESSAFNLNKTIQDAGLGTSSYNIKITLPSLDSSKGLVEYTSDTAPIFDVLKTEYISLRTKWLPILERWYKATEALPQEVGTIHHHSLLQNQEKFHKRAGLALSNARQAARKCDELSPLFAEWLSTNIKAIVSDDDDEDDMVEVDVMAEENDVFETTMSQPSQPTTSDQGASQNENSDAKSQWRKRLLEQAPEVAFDSDLYYWDLKDVPTSLPNAGLEHAHQFWGGGASKEDVAGGTLPESVKERMFMRTVRNIPAKEHRNKSSVTSAKPVDQRNKGKAKAVDPNPNQSINPTQRMRSGAKVCRARLKNNDRLCTYYGESFCPYHGPIIPRDAGGDPLPEGEEQNINLLPPPDEMDSEFDANAYWSGRLTSQRGRVTKRRTTPILKPYRPAPKNTAHHRIEKIINDPDRKRKVEEEEKYSKNQRKRDNRANLW